MPTSENEKVNFFMENFGFEVNIIYHNPNEKVKFVSPF